MPDFVGTYQLAGAPPEQWNAQLRTLASTAGLEVRSTSLAGQRLTLVVRVPKNAAAPASDIAGSFLADALSVFSGGPSDGGRAQLLSTSLVRPRPASIFDLRRSIIPYLYALLGLVIVLTLPLISSRLSDIYLSLLSTTTATERLAFLVALLGAFLAALGTLNALRREIAERTQKEHQAVQERALVQQVAEEEDPKLRARLELARIALRSRASSMRGDANRLWLRSVWAYRGALGFFLLAIAGPSVAAFLLLASQNPDWHFMFGGLSLAAVPLGIGTALLRHDTKLREQYQEAARDVASLERYELALDYARIASPETYQRTMQQVIQQLLLSRPGLLAPARGAPPGIGKEADGEGSPGVQRLFDVTVEKAGEVVAAIVPKKGG
ncbi:hypothetical protein [Stigmatella aurantiaca]|uniref:Uncharacterized protein n=1 Tax=Stigmatella aurantiaca (strain DW4/3-1) TaxID=378806 RepID=Q09D86_STIAD|nr:hypothetical protein [Stigmatella aurantiaca]ADO67820.1 uncharacterized protein STAUR_0011 [Stigmatella aurantiaca DW4/3-1]EAU69626.1 hypothetical protein STIAU_2991 [Stigmatella aurantiaca DW4/3-1]